LVAFVSFVLLKKGNTAPKAHVLASLRPSERASGAQGHKDSTKATKMKKTIFFCLLFFSSFATAQDETGWQFIPSGLLFRPLVAPTIEPRAGVMKMTGNNTLRLDIGNSIDLIGYTPENEKSPTLAIGADFFTFTRIKSESGFHFPVDAVDYLFGINASTILRTPERLYSLRLRLSHISAHLVDGHYDNESQLWKNGQTPRVYSREFFDLVGATEFTSLTLPLRIYTGMQYLYNVDPRGLPRFSGQFGSEISSGSIIGLHITAYAATDFRIMKVNVTTVQTTIQTGIKFGMYNGRGLNVFFSYFNGMSIHGEYYDQREEYGAVGIKFDF
jgi:hypothetical protein